MAHEFAHYLAEYLAPRERAVRRLGPTVLPVLDGDRPPTAAEQWAGALAGVSLGLHAHYLERAYDPARDADTDAAERRANVLGLELLAPWREVVAAADGSAAVLEPLLIGRYGLPAAWAAGYARRLTREVAKPTPSRTWGL